MQRSIEHELSAHTGALRALARSLVGTQDADDLVQDAAVEALEARGERPRWLRAWLARVLRNLATKHRRAKLRRRTHEENAAELAASPSPDRVAAHREAVQRLTSALMTLPEPYQGTLLLRYFEDLSPRAIAAQTGVPVATVKSRLQRGLAMLRMRLDGLRDGDDWRPALALAFGLERGAGVAGGAFGVAAGVVFMSTFGKWLVGGLVAVLALGATWFVFRGEVDGLRVGRAPSTELAVQALATSVVDGEGERTVATAPSRTLALPPAPDAAAGTATIRGRCVDGDGRPLADVTARVSATSGVASPSPPSQRTGPEGDFLLLVPAAADLEVRVELTAAGRCACRGRWNALTPGEVIDLGDVVLPVGIMVRGRVVDTGAQPVVGVGVEVFRDQIAGVPRPLLGPDLQSHATTDAHGVFTVGPLPPGRGSALVRSRRLTPRGGSGFALDPALREVTLELVVFSDAELPPIRGQVVDESGRPVARASVCCDRGNGDAQTDAVGEFTLRITRIGPLPKTVGLYGSATGFKSTPSGPHPLGAQGVRIVLARTGEVLVRVRDAATGAPVSRFALDLRRAPPGFENLTRLPCRTWPEGLGRVQREGSGEHRVYVDPDDGVLAPSSFVPVASAGVTEVLLTRLASRQLVVRDTEGEFVAGARVELLDPLGPSITLDNEAFPIEAWDTLHGPPKSILLQDAHTDAGGGLLLRGPLGRDLALRLRGPGIALQTIAPVRLDGETPLEVTAARGATWTGRLVPTAVAAALYAGSQAPGNQKPSRRAFGVELWRPSNERFRRYLETLDPYAADGSFRLEGIPAGTWGVTVFGLGAQYPAASIEVREGEALVRDVDVSAMRPIDVELQVFVDGVPLADSLVAASGQHGRGLGGRLFQTQVSGDTDADGTVRLTTFAGRLGCDLYVRAQGGTRLVSAPPLEVTTSGRAVLDVRVGRLALRVLQPDGRPAAGLPIALAGGVHRQSEQTTDADGLVTWPHLPHAAFVVRARQRSLRDEAGRGAYARIHGWDATHAAWLDVGVVTLGPSTGDGAIELRLPPEWDR